MPNNAPTLPASGRNHTIDFLRFVFSFVIASFHLMIASDILSDDAQKTFYFFHGNNGVEFFFLVSGFLMALSADRQLASGVHDIGSDSVRFMLRKIKAFIVPMYASWIPCFIIYSVFTPDLSAKALIQNLEKSIYELLFLRNAGFKGYYVMGQTWYISAMLLTMLVCYPLLLKLKNAYIYCVAPAAAAILLGYLNHEYTSLVNTSLFIGILYKSQIRAFGVINLGVLLYAVFRKFKNVSMTGTGTALLSIVELWGYGFALYYMCAVNTPNRDALVLMYMAISVLISFSQRTWLRMLTDKFPRLCDLLSKYSLYLYLSHFAICKKIIPLVADRFGVGKRTYVIGVAMIFALMFIVMLLADLIRRLLPHLRKALVLQRQQT